jgi:hypothetical protein
MYFFLLILLILLFKRLPVVSTRRNLGYKKAQETENVSCQWATKVIIYYYRMNINSFMPTTMICNYFLS